MPKGCYISEAPFAPRPPGKSEDDGYLLTFVTNLNSGKGECAIFDAQDATKANRAHPPAHQCRPAPIRFWAPAELLTA